MSKEIEIKNRELPLKIETLIKCMYLMEMLNYNNGGNKLANQMVLKYIQNLLNFSDKEMEDFVNTRNKMAREIQEDFYGFVSQVLLS